MITAEEIPQEQGTRHEPAPSLDREAMTAAALDYHGGGLSIIPVNARKKPAIEEWKPYQSERSTPEQIKEWAVRSDVAGFAAVCGEVSGGLVIEDFDVAGFFERFIEAVKQKPEVSGLAYLLPIQQTGSGNHQMAFRCGLSLRNDKLAYSPADNKEGREIAIETRAGGGYAVLPPSFCHLAEKRGVKHKQAYKVLQGDFANIPSITNEQAQRLIEVARSLCQAPLSKQQMKAVPLSPRSNGGSVGGGVIGRFNEVYGVGAILSRNNYQPRGGNRYLAPDSTTGEPGVYIFEDTGTCYSHHGNDPLNDRHAHDPFSVFCLLEHGGNVTAAVKAAAAELGIERPQAPAQEPLADAEEEEYIRAEQAAKQEDAQKSELPPDWRGPEVTSKPALVSLEQILAMKFPAKSEIIGNGIWPAVTGLMMAGESGAGKSLLLNQLVINLAMGWNFIGLKVPTARRVLVFQAENTLQQEQERYLAQIQGLEITATPQGVAYYPMNERLELSSAQVRKRMIDAILDHRAAVFFVDPLISFHAANENDNAAMRQVLDYITEIMRKTGAGAGVLHHFGKPTEGSVVEHRARGASAIRDWCDTMMALTLKRKVDGYQHTVTFSKVRNGRQPKPIILDRDENLVFWVTEEVSACPPEKVAMIIKTLGGRVNGQKNLIAAIRDLIDCGERTARKFIAAALEAGAILVIPGDRDPSKPGPPLRAYVHNNQV